MYTCICIGMCIIFVCICVYDLWPIFPLYPCKDNRKKIWFSEIPRECGVGVFARNGSITDMGHGM